LAEAEAFGDGGSSGRGEAMNRIDPIQAFSLLLAINKYDRNHVKSHTAWGSKVIQLFRLSPNLISLYAGVKVLQ
jgi:hypothetical protein